MSNFLIINAYTAVISICLLVVLLAAGSIGFQFDSKRDFIVAELIHSHSYMSPASRATSLDRINNFSSPRHDIVARHTAESEIIFNKGGYYLMKINVDGQNLLLVVTTGSESIWMQCETCDDCYEQDEPLFLPNPTDGYKEVRFESEECEMLQNDDKFSDNDMCGYKFSYREKVSVTAILSRARQTSFFDSSVESKFPMYFGCVHQSSGKKDFRAQGMVSLSYGDYSLITQLVKVFHIAKMITYCLLPYGETRYSKIIFGNKVRISTEKVAIPFNTKDGLPYYYVSLSHVRVNNKPALKMPGVVGIQIDNIIIDPGTMTTLLPDPTYTMLVAEVTVIVGRDHVVHHEEFGLCFRDTENIFNVRSISLIFHSARVTLKKDQIFREILKDTVRIYCMMIEEAKEGTFPVLGSYAQQGFEVEYNLENEKISFAKADCYDFGRVPM